MKVLLFGDLAQEDRLTFSFTGALQPHSVLEKELEPLLESLERFSSGWMPDVVEGKRRRRYSRAAIWKTLDEERWENGATIGFSRTSWPALDMTLNVHLPPLPPAIRVAGRVQPLSFFTDPECCRAFVEMVRSWAERYPVIHAMAHSLADDSLCGAPLFGRDVQTSRRDGFDKIYEISWLNVFGPRLVASVGRERMLSTPAWKVEALPNGAILLVTRPTVADFACDEARQAQARAHIHLRPDLDGDTVLRTLRERSATLAPVEPHFHPDVAPLLTRTLDRFAIHERQRKIAEYNAWQPPAPAEWLPAEASLPVDVADPARVCAHYQELAERLVALLHAKVSSVFDESPESLIDTDFYFWREEFPTSRLRENIDAHAVPAIGAYLGQVLVRHLGGRWLPREKLEETQVLVGTRAWLPFVRAHRYMRSRQSLLDFSLSQLYRVAARHGS